LRNLFSGAEYMSRARIRVAALAAAGLASALATADAQDGIESLQTRAERTAYEETSRYADVMAFVKKVEHASPRIHLTTLGYSHEGRALPLVVVGDVADASAESVMASGKTRVFVQANIHAGEVAGKEAVQLLLRSLAAGERDEWLDSLVLLFAPIYNADGNEIVRLTTRPRQHGPVGGMGQRANAQGLDLNRDHMKLESPEAHSLVAFMRSYDPHVLMDLHTTNGTIRAYHLLYAPPLHPNTDQAMDGLLRSQWLPATTRGIRDEHGWETYFYGNLPWRGSRAERGWYTYDHRPRYNTNYVGLRNRFGILSEAYSYATFEERVLATLAFVEEVLEFAYLNAATVRRLTEEADARDLTGSRLALRAQLQPSDSVEILLGEVVEERNPYSGRVMLRMTDARSPELLPEFGRFRAVESALAPTAYLVPAELGSVLDLLDDHGIEWWPLKRAETRTVRRFLIDSTLISGREYQGHLQRELFGRLETVDVSVPEGTALVPMAQPLGRLVFALLEPRSDDGVVNWNFLDEALEGAEAYPILMVPAF
jgi:hypothetical protein